MRILYLAHRIPYPPNKGDKIRSFNEVKYLSRSHGIDLACLADNPADLRYQYDLRKHCTQVEVVPLDPTRAKLKALTSLWSRKPLSVAYLYSAKLQQTVNRWLSETNYDSIICFSSQMAEYVFRSKCLWTGRAQGPRLKVFGDQGPRIKDRGNKIERSLPYAPCSMPAVSRLAPILIIDFCDVDSDKWAQYAAASSFPRSFVYALEHRRLAAYERDVAERFDHSVFVSDQEANIFTRQNPHITNISVIPNGVDHEYFSPGTGHPRLEIRNEIEGFAANAEIGEDAPMPPTSNLEPPSRRSLSPPTSDLYPPTGRRPQPHAPCPMLLFTGAMDYHANVDGVLWFSREILPRIQSQRPGTEFFIVGSNPAREIRSLHNGNGITVTGFVDDVRPYYDMADLSVIPLRLARGVQNKVLEAMAMAKAVVTTRQAIQGISAKHGEHLLVADDSDAFCDAIIGLLRDDSRRPEIGLRAREFVKANYDWNANMSKLEELLVDSAAGSRMP